MQVNCEISHSTGIHTNLFHFPLKIAVKTKNYIEDVFDKISYTEIKYIRSLIQLFRKFNKNFELKNYSI